MLVFAFFVVWCHQYFGGDQWPTYAVPYGDKERKSGQKLLKS
jgi:hypothetical protein